VSIVHPSRADELAPARSTHVAARKSLSAGPATASFASLHQAALKSTNKAATGGAVAPGTDVKAQTPAATTPAAPTPATVDRAAAPIKLRRNESLEAVAGHSYAEVNGGARDGMYVNTTGNKRRGQAFVLVHRNGIEYHIYGKGKDRLVVALKAKPADTTPDNKATAPNTASSGGTTPTGTQPGTTPTVTPTGTTGAKVGGTQG
jgi:hypothetical protein